ncbi:MAG: hypothetical protein FJW38_08615 [Acidobacteria bacterium]|nr:hypothetical protein [Acidobacteriota bacterium]
MAAPRVASTPMTAAAAPAPAPIAAPFPPDAAAPIAAPAAVVVPAPAASRPLVGAAPDSINCVRTGICRPSASAISIISTARCDRPLIRPARTASVTRPSIVCPRRATTTPSTITGCASVAVNTSPVRFVSDDIRSSTRTLIQVPAGIVIVRCWVSCAIAAAPAAITASVVVLMATMSLQFPCHMRSACPS